VLATALSMPHFSVEQCPLATSWYPEAFSSTQPLHIQHLMSF